MQRVDRQRRMDSPRLGMAALTRRGPIQAALKELLDLGYQSTPVTIIDGQAIVGFDQAKISELLGI